jgi:hypothetical protein
MPPPSIPNAQYPSNTAEGQIFPQRAILVEGYSYELLMPGNEPESAGEAWDYAIPSNVHPRLEPNQFPQGMWPDQDPALISASTYHSIFASLADGYRSPSDNENNEFSGHHDNEEETGESGAY